jgi:hypothetical protein
MFAVVNVKDFQHICSLYFDIVEYALLWFLLVIITHFWIHLPMYFVIFVSESVYQNSLFCFIAALCTRCLPSYGEADFERSLAYATK